MKRKSFTSYKKAKKKGKKPVGVMLYSNPRMNRPYRSITLQPEVKFFDTAGTTALAATADWTGSEIACDNYIQSDGTTLGAYTDCALIPSANGPGYGQVLGGKYRILKIRIRGLMAVDASTAVATVPDNSLMSRLALVMDKNAGGAQLQGETVFSDMGSVYNCIFSYQQQGQATDKYRVLKDEIFQHDVAAMSTAFDSNDIKPTYKSVNFSWTYTPAKPLIVNVLTSGSTPAVAQLKDINIFLLGRSSGAGDIFFTARCYYTDT